MGYKIFMSAFSMIEDLETQEKPNGILLGAEQLSNWFSIAYSSRAWMRQIVSKLASHGNFLMITDIPRFGVEKKLQMKVGIA